LRYSQDRGVEFNDLKLIRNYDDGSKDEVDIYFKVVSPETELGCSDNLINVTGEEKLFIYELNQDGEEPQSEYIDIFTTCGDLSKFSLDIISYDSGVALVLNSGELPILKTDTTAAYDSGSINITF